MTFEKVQTGSFVRIDNIMHKTYLMKAMSSHYKFIWLKLLPLIVFSLFKIIKINRFQTSIDFSTFQLNMFMLLHTPVKSKSSREIYLCFSILMMPKGEQYKFYHLIFESKICMISFNKICRINFKQIQIVCFAYRYLVLKCNVLQSFTFLSNDLKVLLSTLR